MPLAQIYNHLLPPFRFTSTPSADLSFTSSPSPFTRPTGRRSRSTASETQAIIPDREDPHRTPDAQNPHSGQVKVIRFYIEARDKDRDWTYMEKTRQLCTDGYRRIKDEAVELYEQCVDYIRGEEHESGEGIADDKTSQATTPQQSSWLGSTLRKTLSPLVTTFSSSTSAGSASIIGTRYEPGTFSTGQVHGEMKYDAETKKWEYRKLWVDIPKSGTIGARRVWIVKRLGDVKR